MHRRLPEDDDGYSRDLAAAREAMAADDFEANWSEGAAVRLAEAVAYAGRGFGRRRRAAGGWEALTPTRVPGGGAASALVREVHRR